MYNSGKYFILARYGMFSPDAVDADNIARLSTGTGWVIFEGCELRGEYQVNSNDSNAG